MVVTTCKLSTYQICELIAPPFTAIVLVFVNVAGVLLHKSGTVKLAIGKDLTETGKVALEEQPLSLWTKREAV